MGESQKRRTRFNHSGHRVAQSSSSVIPRVPCGEWFWTTEDTGDHRGNLLSRLEEATVRAYTRSIPETCSRAPRPKPHS